MNNGCGVTIRWPNVSLEGRQRDGYLDVATRGFDGPSKYVLTRSVMQKTTKKKPDGVDLISGHFDNANVG